MRRSFDVVVIGGGIIGTAVTYYLARQGIDVVLVEKNSIASGTSSACDGCIFLQSKKPGPHLELAIESAQLYEELSDELDADIEYERCGGMIVVETERQMPDMKNFVNRQRDYGLNVKFLNTEEALRMEPNLSPEICGTTYYKMDAHVNPMQVLFSYSSAAKRYGAEILTNTKVTGLVVSKNSVISVKTNRGKIATEVVVNAAGIHAPEVAEMVGINLAIKPRRGQILVTEAMWPMIKHVMLCACYITAKFSANSKEADLGVGSVIEQTRNGNILIGSTREFVGPDQRVSLDGIREVARHAQNIMPVLGKLHLIRTFAGLRPYTPDGMPILGKPDNAPEGFIVAAGHEGDGIALAPITGKRIAEIITEG